MRIAKCRNDTLYIYSNKTDVDATRVIKSLSQRRFFSEPRPHWQAPLTLESVLELKASGFKADATIHNWLGEIFRSPTFDPDFNIPGLAAELLPYQKEGIQHLDQLGGNALIADDPGLGKSVQSIAWCHWRNKQKILIFCPAFGKYNWEEEINFWTGETSIQIVTGKQEVELTERYTIVNYDILMDQDGLDIRDDLFEQNWDVVIIDESHYISNPEAVRTLAVKALVAGVPHIIPMSATPGKNRPADLFTAINLVNEKVFPSFRKYGHKYCGAKQVRGQWEFKGSTNELELYELLKRTVMIRRTKDEVFKELPKRVRIPILLEGGTEFNKKEMTFDGFERMKMNAVKKKMPQMIEWIKNLLLTEDKVIIFGEHKWTMDTLFAEFKDIAVRVDGTVPSVAARKEAVYKFQRCARCGVKKDYHTRVDEACEEYVPDLTTRIFLGSRAAKESGTLTAAYHTVFTELWWSMDDHNQAEGRAYGRAGDLHGTTNWYMIGKGTIEEEIAKLISLKDNRVSMTMNGKKVTPDLLLSALIRRYKGGCNE